MWTSSAGMGSDARQARSAQIEMTSYVLLALFRRGSFNEAIELMKWLSMQRNHLGGYGTTQVRPNYLRYADVSLQLESKRVHVFIK